jgi:hypothetical protein
VLGGPEVREVVLAVATTAPADEADLGLKGVYRGAEPFLRSTFTRMGDDALDGLAATMAHPE